MLFKNTPENFKKTPEAINLIGELHYTYLIYKIDIKFA